MILCLWFIIQYKQLVCKGLVLEGQVQNIHVQLIPNIDESVSEQQVNHSHSSSFQIVAFGIGSILFLLTEPIKDAFKNNTDRIRLMTSSLSPPSCMVFIIFLHKYHKVVLKNCKWFHYCISLMLAAEVCTWISVTVKPLCDLTSENSTEITYNASHHNQIDFRFETGLELLQCFLQPIFVEFLSISTVCLFGLLKMMQYRLYDQQDSNNTPPIDNRSEEDEEALLGHGASSGHSHSLENTMPVNNANGYTATLSNDPNCDETMYAGGMASPSINSLPCDLDVNSTSSETLHQYDHDPSSSNSRLQQDLDTDTYENIQTIIIVTLSSIIAICFVAAFTLLPPVPIFPIKSHAILDYNFIKTILYFCVGGILLILIFLSLFKINSDRMMTSKRKPLSGSDYLLLLASSAFFVYSSFWIIALSNLIKTKENATKVRSLISFWICSIILVWSQTQLILTTHCIYDGSPKAPKMGKFLKFVFIYLVAVNIALWLANSSGHKWFENDVNFFSSSLLLVPIFGEFRIKMVMFTFLPMCDIYFFHSAVMAYELLRRKKTH